MKIQTGMTIMQNVKPVDGDRVVFVAEDGREMFEVCAGKDGRSLEIRSPAHCKVGGVLYSNSLIVEPNCANSITISTRKYE